MSREMNIAAHSVGAVAISGFTLASAFAGAAAYQILTFNTQYILITALAGAAIGFSIGLAITKALGGDRVAVAGGCAAGIVAHLLSPSLPVTAILLAIALTSGIMREYRSQHPRLSDFS